MAESYSAERRKALKDQVEARLRPVCTHFSAEEFEKMVEQIVDTQIRGEQRLSKWGAK